MSVQNGERLATKQDLADMYQGILPYLGGMPEVLANKFSKGDMYSTDEKMIGQWTDGKPLYQKTVLNTGLSLSWSQDKFAWGTFVTAPIQNVENIVGIAEIVMANETVTPTQYVYAFANVQVNNDGSWTIFSLHGGYEIVKMTLRYTKTTDSAISIGDDTDYSTDEKIVGTWIDGKPLYQKTVTGITGTTGGNATVPHNIANVERIHNISGYALQNNGTNPEYTLSLNFYNGTNRFGAFADITNVYIRHVGFNSTPFVITIQYTKTTD